MAAEEVTPPVLGSGQGEDSPVKGGVTQLGEVGEGPARRTPKKDFFLKA